MQMLVDTLKSKLGPDIVRTNTKIVSISKSSFPAVSGGESMGPLPVAAGDDVLHNTWQIHLANGEILTANAVCLALPSHAVADLLRTLDPELAQHLVSIDYAPAATVNIAFRQSDLQRPLNGIGFVIPHKEHKLVLGCTIANHKFENRAPEGHTLLRAFIGGVQGTEWIGQDDQTLTERVLGELREWLGITGQPLFTQLMRYRHALPQYSIGHLQNILWMEERALRYRGLTLAGNWSYGIGIPDCIQAGERAADQIMAQIERRAPAFS